MVLTKCEAIRVGKCKCCLDFVSYLIFLVTSFVIIYLYLFTMHTHERKYHKTLRYIETVSYTHLDVYKRQVWRRRYNQELYALLFRRVDVMKNIKLSKLRWPAYLIRTTEVEILSEVLKMELDWRRKKGRPMMVMMMIMMIWAIIPNYLEWGIGKSPHQIGTVGEGHWRRSRLSNDF